MTEGLSRDELLNAGRQRVCASRGHVGFEFTFFLEILI
jgi:hypothetical protein